MSARILGELAYFKGAHPMYSAVYSAYCKISELGCRNIAKRMPEHIKALDCNLVDSKVMTRLESVDSSSSRNLLIVCIALHYIVNDTVYMNGFSLNSSQRFV